jgi:hypothetical protein
MKLVTTSVLVLSMLFGLAIGWEMPGNLRVEFWDVLKMEYKGTPSHPDQD